MSKLEEYFDRVKDLAEDAKEQSAAISLGAKEKIQGVMKDVRAVKEIQTGLSELEALPEDGSIIYKMDLAETVNSLSSLLLFISDNRLDDASVAEEIRKVMSKVEPSADIAEEDSEQLAIENAKNIAYNACARALEALNAAE